LLLIIKDQHRRIEHAEGRPSDRTTEVNRLRSTLEVYKTAAEQDEKQLAELAAQNERLQARLRDLESAAQEFVSASNAHGVERSKANGDLLTIGSRMESAYQHLRTLLTQPADQTGSQV